MSAEPLNLLGKHRGQVIDVSDPMGLGRIRAMVPSVSGLVPTVWALPCLPVAGIQYGFFAPPLIGSNVWIEYENGDINAPIWTGCFWLSPADVPKQMPRPGATPFFALTTPTQAALTIDDDPSKGISISTPVGAEIAITSTGVKITNGQGATIELSPEGVKINGTSVNINDGALRVT